MAGLRKPFRDYGELTALLRSRGMAVDDATAIPVLRRVGYYMVVNGYKDLFVDTAASEQAGDDRYLPGTRFDDLWALFRFDRSLRLLLFEGVIHAEAALKAVCAHEFTRAHQDEVNAYLDLSNYDPNHSQGAMFVIGRVFMPLLELDGNPRNRGEYGGKAYIRHYMEAYGGAVPLWVAVNDVSLGPMMRFYQSLTPDVREAVAASLTTLRHGQAMPNHRVTSRRLDSVFNRLVCFRNLCAHDERCFNAHRNGRVNESVTAAFRDLRYLLDPIDYADIQSRLDGLIENLRHDLPDYAGEVLRQMGYPQGA